MNQKSESEWIETLFECIEKLMDLLKTTHAAEQAKAIYEEFFGN